MTEINKKLRSSLLPAPMIIRNYVVGDEDCNYEKYLLEIVNTSEIFKLEIIKDALSVDYLLSLEYRKTKIVEKDTFLMCVFDKQFLLYEYEGGGLVIKEVIPQMKSQTYTKLYCDYGASY